MKRTLILLAMLMLLTGASAMADMVITLPDGRLVNLKNDGTWEFVVEKIDGALTLDFGMPKDQNGSTSS